MTMYYLVIKIGLLHSARCPNEGRAAQGGAIFHIKKDFLQSKKNLICMLDNGQLVHPVHERVAFLDNAFKLTVDTGDKFIPGKQI